jgi:hypothetical protein
LGAPGTSVLFGNSRVNNDFRDGLRLDAGLWLGDCRQCAIEADFFLLGDSGQGFGASGAGSPVLARPFFNSATGLPDSELVAFPGVVAGSVTVDSASSFLGAGLNCRHVLCCGCDYRLDVLVGYRYLRLTDDLTIAENLIATDPAGQIPLGTGIAVRDEFRTENNFHGARVGLAGQWNRGCLVAQLQTSVSLGDTQELVEIKGSTLVTVPGAGTAAYNGGLLALPTNSGRHVVDRFSVVPEVTARLGYQLTDHWTAFAGYSFLYWSSVARAGEQIDLTVNPTQIPPGKLVGEPRPAFNRHDGDFWVQGVSVGLEFRY